MNIQYFNLFELGYLLIWHVEVKVNACPSLKSILLKLSFFSESFGCVVSL